MERTKLYYSAIEISEMLGVSQGTAYKIIRTLNAELNRAGFIVLQGKVAKAYFDEKWYGHSKNVELQGI